MQKDVLYVQKVQDCEGDQKKLYKAIDCLMHWGKPKILPTASSSLPSAKTFNNFFIPKIIIIREQLASLEHTIVEKSIKTLESFLRNCPVVMDTLAPASVKEVTDIIKESSKATCMLDPMPISLVKEVLPHLASFITKIVNIAFSTGTFPSQLKSGIVTPLIMKPNLDYEILKNYRPLFNLPF